MNGISLINIKSDKVSTVTISQTTFTSIAQTGTGTGTVINAQLQQDCILKVTDSCIFYNCSTQQNDDNRGGAINTVVNGSNSQFIVSDLVKFEKCQSFQGGAISVELLNMGICVVNNVQFKECTVNNDGGGIYTQLRETGGTLTITNHTSFVQCINTIWGGGGIMISSNGLNSRCIISDKVIFEKCDAERGGAIFIIPGFWWYNIGSYTATISGSTFSGSKSVNRGGAIFAELYDDAALTIDNTQFESCYSTNSDGGSIFAQINLGSLSLNQVIFTDCNCTQPGSGGAIAINQQNSNSPISITDSSFTNCLTLQRSQSQRYGWGGAIYIQIRYQASLLTETNFLLTDLSFTNCTAFQNIGNNLHIISPDTHATGQAIKSYNLLTVKDLSDPPNIISDLYISPSYAYDYMGINESILFDNPGTIDLDLHDPLFKQFFISNVPNPSYIDAINGSLLLLKMLHIPFQYKSLHPSHILKILRVFSSS
ncbi:MAG: hypothetical protein EZS28_022757 [Streblomastix strix]|uniref:Right handed beta helix domain-containing protein n=1 Tax=Streblomastix strix TaxID=222440 RepID=A0A5J4VGV6_9EUKA|nr:MAG: hypothetical protein EZS28_022757 [Streblomastix strix]